MANTTVYVPIYYNKNRGSMTTRERDIVDCINKDHALEAVAIQGHEFTEEQIEQLQICADEAEVVRAKAGWIAVPVVLGILALGFLIPHIIIKKIEKDTYDSDKYFCY